MVNVMYITSDNIRAALGLSEVELEDTQITNLLVADQLKIDLPDVYPDYEALKTAVDGPSPTPEQVRLYAVLKLWMTYQGAVYLLPELQTLAAQKITDSSTEMQRFIPNNLQETRDQITGQRDKYQAILQTAAGITTVAETAFAIMGVSNPTYDPVAGA